MSDVVERVAIGIHAQRANAHLTKWEDCSEEYRTGTRRDARAAIEAMREPTEAMLDAGGAAVSEWNGDMTPETEAVAQAAWPAMIDAALVGNQPA